MPCERCRSCQCRTWRCSECDCTIDEANRRRARLGLPRISASPRYRTCTPSCAKMRQHRWIRDRVEKTRNYRMPPDPYTSTPSRWRCSECGLSREAAERKRARAGLPRVSITAKTCSPACSDARMKRLYAARFGAPKALRGRNRRAQRWL